MNLSFLIITSIVNTLGLAASAGIGVSEKLFSFLAIVPMAFMSALSAFVAQNMGAGQPQRARQALRNAQGISFAFGVATFLLTFLAGDVLASWFDQDPAVIAATQQYLKSSGFEYLITPLTFCFLGYFNGREHTGFVMFQGLFSAFLVRVPASYLLSRLPGAGMFTMAWPCPYPPCAASSFACSFSSICSGKSLRTVALVRADVRPRNTSRQKKGEKFFLTNGAKSCKFITNTCESDQMR